MSGQDDQQEPAAAQPAAPPAHARTPPKFPLSLARGPLVVVLDSGDRLLPGYWAEILKAAAASPSADVFYTGAAPPEAPPTESFGVKVGGGLPYRSPLPRGTAFRARLWKAAGGFPPVVLAGDDVERSLWAAAAGGGGQGAGGSVRIRDAPV